MFKVPLTETQLNQIKQSSTDIEEDKIFLNPSVLTFRQEGTGFIIVESDKKFLMFNKEALTILTKGNEPLSGAHFLTALSKTIKQAQTLRSSVSVPGMPLPTQSVVFQSGRRYYSVWTVPLLKYDADASFDAASAKKSLIILERIHMEEPNLPMLNRKFSFTPRESHIVRLLFRGRSDKLIGQALGISTETVREHMRNIRGKLGAASRLEVVSFLIEK